MKASILLLLAPLALAHGVVHPEYVKRQQAVDHRRVCGGKCKVGLLTPEQIEGPYYIDYDIHRSNIREDRPGIPLRLTINLFDVTGSSSPGSDVEAQKRGGKGGGHGPKCTPLPNAFIDVWHADALGVYSGYGQAAEVHNARSIDWNLVLAERANAQSAQPTDVAAGVSVALPVANSASKAAVPTPSGATEVPPPSSTSACPPPPTLGPDGKPTGGGGGPECGPGHQPPTNNLTFLRGVQQTDKFGRVVFETIFPGWYASRTPHIHIKVHSPTWEQTERNETHTHTTQVFFDQAVDDFIATLAPNKNNQNLRILNKQDIFYFPNGTNNLEVKYVDNIQKKGHVEATMNLGIDRWW